MCMCVSYFKFLTSPKFAKLDINIELTSWRSPNFVLSAFAKLLKALVSFVMSVRPSARPPAWNNVARTGRISKEFDILAYFKKIFREKSSFIKISQ
jgi:hypothetical protein